MLTTNQIIIINNVIIIIKIHKIDRTFYAAKFSSILSAVCQKFEVTTTTNKTEIRSSVLLNEEKILFFSF